MRKPSVTPRSGSAAESYRILLGVTDPGLLKDSIDKAIAAGNSRNHHGFRCSRQQCGFSLSAPITIKSV